VVDIDAVNNLAWVLPSIMHVSTPVPGKNHDDFMDFEISAAPVSVTIRRRSNQNTSADFADQPSHIRPTPAFAVLREPSNHSASHHGGASHDSDAGHGAFLDFAEQEPLISASSAACRGPSHHDGQNYEELIDFVVAATFSLTFPRCRISNFFDHPLVSCFSFQNFDQRRRMFNFFWNDEVSVLDC